MKTIQQKMRTRILAFVSLITLTIIIGAAYPRPISAQWATNAGGGIYNTNTGNVGIGTSAPASLLEINKAQMTGTSVVVDNGYNSLSNGAFSGIFFRQAGVNRFFLGSLNSGNNTLVGGAGAAHVWNFASGPTIFATSDLERMRLTAAGNFGLGTTTVNERFVNIGNSLFGGATNRTELWSGFTSTINPALFEINSGAAVSNDTRFATLTMGTSQSGASNVIGAIYFANSSLAAAEKRISSIGSLTDGATDSGNLTFATSNAGALAEKMRIDKAGNVGIGKTAPASKLDVNGTVNASGFTVNGAAFAASQWSTTGANVFYNSGNVGIGTGTPGSKLDVSGTINAAAFTVGGSPFTASQWSTTGANVFYNAGNVGIGTGTPGSKLDVNGTINAAAFTVGGSPFTASQWSTTGANVFFNTGNVGIGTGTPTSKLHVNGTVNATAFTINGNPFTGSQWGTTGSNVFYDTGNVGIGTNAPTSKLHVNGTVNATAFTINGSPFTGSQWGTTGSNVFYDTGNVGIGTNAPTSKLHVNGTVNATSFTVNGTPFTGSQWSTTGANVSYSSGNVGIGTGTPTAKLEVSGNINVSGTGNINASGTITGGNIIAKYQDVAEWVESSQALAPGTVVVLDQTRSNQVVASSEVYDTRVAGVISAQPGITLGESGKGKVLVATTGRVMINVDATGGPIRIGDLLVTSDRPGVAMRSQSINVGGVQLHRPGTLIGKALESLEGGTGRILVLLSLQ